MSPLSNAFRSRAAWLYEREAPGWISDDSEASQVLGAQHFQPSARAIIDRRLAAWQQVISRDRPEDFERRLAWDGWADRIVTLLSPNGRFAAPDHPSWLKCLDEIMSVEVTRFGEGAFPDALPFAELYAGPIAVARKGLSERIPSDVMAVAGVSQLALGQLERHLGVELSHLCADSLFAEFCRFRPVGYDLLARMNVPPSSDPGREWYWRFIKSLTADSLRGYFERHPVIARLCGVLTDTWIDSTSEFIRRLANDRDVIATMVAPTPVSGSRTDAGEVLGPITNIATGLSDRHHGGRTVLALRFASGVQVVYKPRSVALEAAWQKILAWCNETGALPADLHVVEVRDRGTHGWMSFVERQPCVDERAVHRFYVRAGELLCLLHIFRAIDCHLENLVAAGEQPVLIDAETLLHPDVPPIEGSVATRGSANDHYERSVLRVGLLPQWQYDSHLRIGIDVSGLAGGRVEELRALPDWVAVNTDDMRKGLRQQPSFSRNLPQLHGAAIDGSLYVDAIVDGFTAMYRVLQERQVQLLHDHSPIGALRALPIRVILRVTQTYNDVQAAALAETVDGADASIAIDALTRGVVHFQQKPAIWRAIAAETSSLLNLDIPYFASMSDSTDLLFDGGRLDAFFARSGLDDMTCTLQSLSDADARMQVAFIRAAFHARIARASVGRASNRSMVRDAHAPLAQEKALEAAEGIAQEIAVRAFRDSDGSANWIELCSVERDDVYQLRPLNATLYDGVCGVALFLTALDTCEGNTRYRDLADAALLPLKRLLRDDDRARRVSASLPIGAAAGIGSVAYAFALIGALRGDPGMEADARRVAAWLDPRRIDEDRQLDVLGGAAGAALALLAVHEVVDDPDLVNRARVCGDHLLACRTGTEGLRAWPTFGSTPLAGFSHGASGIAFALVRLAEVTGENKFADAAREAIAFERTLFSVEHQNWADLRYPLTGAGPVLQVAWCHGAAGIGLARLGILEHLSFAAIAADLEAAITTTLTCEHAIVDHVCCGNSGRIELLLEAGLQLGRPDLVRKASCVAAAMVARAEGAGGFNLIPDIADRVVSVGFFRGIAGIGYELLRLHHANRLPSILRFAGTAHS